MIGTILLATLAGAGSACTAGSVLDVRDRVATVCAHRDASVGDIYAVRRLGPADGPPGRLPFLTWSDVGKIRIDTLNADQVADATLLHGRITDSDRVMAD